MAGTGTFTTAETAIEGASTKLRKMAVEASDVTSRIAQLGECLSKIGTNPGLTQVIKMAQNATMQLGALGQASAAVARFGASLSEVDKVAATGSGIGDLIARGQALVGVLEENGVAVPALAGQMLGAAKSGKEFADSLAALDRTKGFAANANTALASTEKFVGSLRAQGVAIPQTADHLLGAGRAALEFGKDLAAIDGAKGMAAGAQSALNATTRLVGGLRASGIEMPKFADQMLGGAQAVLDFAKSCPQMDAAGSASEKIGLLLAKSQALAAGLKAAGIEVPQIATQMLGAGQSVLAFAKSFDDLGKAKDTGEKISLVTGHARELLAGLKANGVAVPEFAGQMLNAASPVYEFAKSFQAIDQAQNAGDKLSLLISNSQRLVTQLQAGGVAIPQFANQVLGGAGAVTDFAKTFASMDKSMPAGDKFNVLVQASQKLSGALQASGEQVPAFVQHLLAANGPIQQFAGMFGQVDHLTGGLASKLVDFGTGKLGVLSNGFLSAGGKIAQFAAGGMGSLGVRLASLASSVLPMVSGAFMSLGTAIMATPIGWIIAGIVAVCAAGYLIYKFWGPIKTFFLGIWHKVVDAFKWAFKNVIKWIPGVALVKLIIDNWKPITKFFSGIWNGVIGIFTWAWNKISPIVDGVVNGVKAVLGFFGLGGGDSSSKQPPKPMGQNGAKTAPRNTPGAGSGNQPPHVGQNGVDHTPHNTPAHDRGTVTQRQSSRGGSSGGPKHITGPVSVAKVVAPVQVARNPQPKPPPPPIPVKGSADIRVLFENAPSGTRASVRVRGQNPPDVGAHFK